MKPENEKSFDLLKFTYDNNIKMDELIEKVRGIEKILCAMVAFITDDDGIILQKIFFERNLN